MNQPLSGLPSSFSSLLEDYYSQITDAIQKRAHHDYRRALLMEFLRKSFGIEVYEIELEKKIKAAEARGRIDAFYKFVIFEIKVDMDRERVDAIRELKKYFESRDAPADYVAVVTDGLLFEIYDYDVVAKEPKEVRPFQVDPTKPDVLYSQLDELLASGTKLAPSSDDLVMRFGLQSVSYRRASGLLSQAYESVRKDTSVEVKYREWNALLAKVYGSAVGDESLFLKHTYLTVLSRAIVTLTLFPEHTRSHELYRELLTGEFFLNNGIRNLAEPDFFSWCLDTTAEIHFLGVIDALFARLDEFDWRDVEEDLLKMLYQELVDPADRSGLGEFYTPDWLAELVLQDLQYGRESLLDPSCGSGTFLFAAIHRLRKTGLAGAQLVQFVMNNLVGLDVHPVAVLMAKANVLIALAPELKSRRDYHVSIGVYIADTLQTVERKGKKYLAIPDGMGHEFTIPSASLDRGRDLDEVISQMVAFAQRGAASTTLTEQARKGFLGKLREFTTDELNLWNFNFSLLVDLIQQKRDTVWGFILKNAFRPAYLRRTKVDVIVGNPPWLSFRDIAEKAYKQRIKELTFGYGLLEKADTKLFTQMDTATLFFAHCKTEFLRNGGRMAFVMPKTTVLPAKQHAGFQREGVSRIDDFSHVSVAGLRNQHFFNVKSCVVTLDGATLTSDIPITHWRGTLPKKNLTLAQSEHLLSTTKAKHDFLALSGSRSPYYELALQGATLNPHTLWYVEPDKSKVLNLKQPFVRTSPEAFRLCKEKKWKLKVTGQVEREFLFSTAASEDLLPFYVRNLRLVALPVMVRDNRYIMVQSENILAEGFPEASDWVRRAESIFRKKTKAVDTSAQDYLNYQNKLTIQSPNVRFAVLYNKSGTNVCAAYLPGEQFSEVLGLEVNRFIAESVTYRLYLDSEDEAHYLAGVLNSRVVNRAIKPYQTEGVYAGKRDIHRRPFEVCPIPKFNARDRTHMQVVEQARSARSAVEALAPNLRGRLAKVRETCRDLIAPHLTAIDELVADMFAEQPRPKALRDSKEQAQRPMFGG